MSEGLDKIRQAVPELVKFLQSYLDESGLESDNFIEGLDVTFKGATELFNDFILYVNGGQDPKTKVLDPTDGHNQH